MFIPIGDEPNPSRPPVMTVALIALNVAVTLVSLLVSTQPADPADPLLAEYLRSMAPLLPPGISTAQAAHSVSVYDLVVFRYGFRPAAPSWVALFTHMFLHAGLLHLAGNMLYLWIFGNNVEARLGPLRFLFWYLVTGVAAVALHAVIDLHSPAPVVGASGAISGVLGFYLVWFPRNVIKVWVFLFPFYIGVVRISAPLMLAVYLLLDNVLPLLFAPAEGGVAYGAHIGGFLAGGWWLPGSCAAGRSRSD